MTPRKVRIGDRWIGEGEPCFIVAEAGSNHNGSLNQALFGFGDAVSVPVMEWIAENYLNPLVNELIHGRVLQGPARR